MGMQMNPETQECFGYFGYGNGHFANEAIARAKLLGRNEATLEYCAHCPQNHECWMDMVATVKIARPDETAAFEKARVALVELGISEGVSGSVVAMALQQQGIADPYAQRAMDNTNQGRNDRGM